MGCMKRACERRQLWRFQLNWLANLSTTTRMYFLFNTTRAGTRKSKNYDTFLHWRHTVIVGFWQMRIDTLSEHCIPELSMINTTKFNYINSYFSRYFTFILRKYIHISHKTCKVDIKKNCFWNLVNYFPKKWNCLRNPILRFTWDRQSQISYKIKLPNSIFNLRLRKVLKENEIMELQSWLW